MKEDELLRNKEIVELYRKDVERLLRYLPWLEEKSGTKMISNYRGDGITEHSIAFPVYDGTLMSFIKEARQTRMMDRNYVYIYSRNRVKTTQDEKNLIRRATIRDFHNLSGILSKYVMGGMTKPAVWSQGMEEGIYLELLTKMKEVLEFWDKPLA